MLLEGRSAGGRQNPGDVLSSFAQKKQDKSLKGFEAE